MHPKCFSPKHRFSSQNSGALSVTIVLGNPFLENDFLNTCFTVGVFLSVILITFDHPENESTYIDACRIHVKPNPQFLGFFFFLLSVMSEL